MNGDYIAHRNCWMLDPDVGVWTSRPDAPTFYHHSMKLGHEIVILGGIEFVSEDTNHWATANVWKLGKDSHAWTRLPPMSTGRKQSGAVVVEGRICVFGGSAGYDDESEDEDVEEIFDSAEELDLATGIWTPLPRMPHKVDAPFAFLLSEKER